MREVTDEYLAEVEARCAAATEGPWTANGIGVFPAMIDSIFEPLVFKSYGNAEFTAHARFDVPTLVAEVRRLRGELREAHKLVSTYSSASGHAQGVLMAIGWQGGVDATVEGFRAENERLRAEVARLTTKLETK